MSQVGKSLPIIEPSAAEEPRPSQPPIDGETRSGKASTSTDLLSLLLQQQSDLTAVEQFSQRHDHGISPQAKSYVELLPASPPGEGQQYAFEVDLDCCSGCKACVTACHALNGLDEQETWRDVGLLIGGTVANPVMQHVTTACHHCLEPGCMSACPVDAYEKDPITGIVKHLDDQCFGCQYCTLACPYDVPKFHAGKGIVRKCDMCSDRLSVGEAPACVQACPHQAIRIAVVDVDDVVDNAEADLFLPAAPDPQITLPTTHYKTSRVFPRNTLPANYHDVNPQHPHWPLIVMLVLTQLSVGAFIVGLWMDRVVDEKSLVAFRQLHALTALGFGLLALAASTLHLGRPQYAYRAVIGLRHSWLSREIVAFGAFAGAATAYAATCWLWPTSTTLNTMLGISVAVTGVTGLFCSVMIYVATGRECWSFVRTAAKFALTSTVLGVAATWLSLLVFALGFDPTLVESLSKTTGVTLVQAVAIAMASKLALEASLLRHLLSRRQSPLKRSAMLMVGPLSNSTFARFACGIMGGIVMPLFLCNALAAGQAQPVLVTVSVAMLFLACLVGELLERFQFFAACASPRMPGGA